jgi:hypothetical protein
VSLFLRNVDDTAELTAFSARRFLAGYRQGHSPVSVRSIAASVRLYLRFGAVEGLLPPQRRRWIEATKGAANA